MTFSDVLAQLLFLLFTAGLLVFYFHPIRPFAGSWPQLAGCALIVCALAGETVLAALSVTPWWGPFEAAAALGGWAYLLLVQLPKSAQELSERTTDFKHRISVMSSQSLFSQRVLTNLLQALHDKHQDPPSDAVLAAILDFIEKTYCTEFTPPALSLPPRPPFAYTIRSCLQDLSYKFKLNRIQGELEPAEAKLTHIETAILAALTDFAASLPALARQPWRASLIPAHPKTPVPSITLIDLYQGQDIDGLYKALHSLAAQPRPGLFTTYLATYDAARNYVSMICLSPSAAVGTDPARRAWLATPLARLFHTELPITIPDQDRFAHHWIIGRTNSGKTAYLSALINHDLDRVARGECSLFVMDSQNELIPHIARLQRFAQDGDLAHRLVYLEPDPDHPLALNMFDVDRERMAALSNADREQLMRSAMQLANFFLKSVVKADTSAHMDILIQYLLPALMSIPDATVFDLKRLVEPDGYAHYEPHFAQLDPEIRRWLKSSLPEPRYKVTRDAIKTRLDGFTADPMFRKMFSSPRNRLDLFAELQGAKVILINTKRAFLREATEPFGRFFIAKLLQAAEERMFIDPRQRLPVFCYIDEATDYIAEERNIAELLDRARKQKVGLTLAHQGEDQIKSQDVLGALRRAATHTRTQRPGFASVTHDGTERVLNVPFVAFDAMLKMQPTDWWLLQNVMHVRYCVPPSDAEPPRYRPPGSGEPPTDPAGDY